MLVRERSRASELERDIPIADAIYCRRCITLAFQIAHHCLSLVIILRVAIYSIVMLSSP